MASPMMADFGDHTYFKKIILQLNIKRSQSVHMDFVICLYNLRDRESEKLASLNNYVQRRVNFENFVLSGVAKVRSQHKYIDVFHFL